CDTIAADRAVAARLKISVGAPVVRYRATRLRNGTPYGVATDVIPQAIAQHITTEVLAASPTIVEALALAGSRVAESLQRLEPAELGTADAERCGASPGDPVLAITGVAYNTAHTPIDAYTLTVITGYGIGLHLTRAGTDPQLDTS
ncbi:MAG: UTRA domain-containing protein, partial [Mycobacterium sp.]|nr:UTRA domain-containing protein [Mycobacterium sp.]